MPKRRIARVVLILLCLSLFVGCESPKSALDRGVRLANEGRFNEAISSLQKAVQGLPNDGLGQSYLGHAYLMTRNYDLAESHLKLALELKPNDEGTLNNLACIKIVRGEFESAESLLNRALKINPSSDIAYNLLAQTYLGLGRPREAIVEVEKAMRLNPNDEGAQFVLAIAYDLLGKYAESSLLYDEARGYPATPWITINRKVGWPPGIYHTGDEKHPYDCGLAAAHCYFLSGDYRKTEELLREVYPRGWSGIALRQTDRGATVIEVLPGSPTENASIQTGDIIQEIEGKSVNMRSAYNFLLKATPGIPIKININRNGQQRILTITPSVRPNGALAWCYVMKGDYEEALKIFQDCHRIKFDLLSPWEPAQRGISIALFKKGEEEKSKEAWGWSYLGAEFYLSMDIYVQWIWPNTPAKKSGLKHGDIILSYAGKEIEANYSGLVKLLERISRTPIDLPVPIKVKRGEEEIELMVELELHPKLKK